MLIVKALLLGILSMNLWATTVSADVSNGQRVVLSLIKDVSVNGSRVYLSDVASCSGDMDLCREASGIDVLASPTAGRGVPLNQATIMRILEKEWPNVHVVFEGADMTRIVGANAEVRTDDIRQTLQAWINDRLDYASGVRLSVTKVVIPYGSGIRPSQTVIDFPDLEGVPFNQSEWLARNMTGVRLTQFRFTNPQDPEDRQIAHGQAHFTLERMIPVATSALPAGTILEAKDVALQWVQIRRGAFEFVERQDQVIGRKLRQMVPSGEPLNMRSLEVANVVNRNQQVTMIVRSGSVEISAKATTMDAGVKDQIVDVVNVANKKRMRAKVIDAQTVEAVAF